MKYQLSLGYAPYRTPFLFQRQEGQNLNLLCVLILFFQLLVQRHLGLLSSGKYFMIILICLSFNDFRIEYITFRNSNLKRQYNYIGLIILKIKLLDDDSMMIQNIQRNQNYQNYQKQQSKTKFINNQQESKMCFFSKSQKKPKVLTKTTLKKAFKLVLCGNAAVGKTSITMRYKEGMFKKTHEPTLAGAYQQKKVKIKNGEQIQLNIWDTAGDERFRSIMPLYYRDAQIALLVFDLTDPQSFKGVDYWLNELQEKVKTEGMLLCLVGNKKDLIEQRRITTQEGKFKAQQKRNCLYHETSALSGQGIEELFQKVVEEYLKMKKTDN